MIRLRKAFTLSGLLCLIWLISACGTLTPPPSRLPPSASDFKPLGSIQLCDSQSSFLATHKRSLKPHSWGTGETIKITSQQNGKSDGFYFFNEDGLLIGAAFRFPDGVNLSPYPILRKTLSQLPPTLEFFLNSQSLVDGGKLETATLYRTGDKTSTTRYIVLKENSSPILLATATVLDPYESLLAQFQNTLIPNLADSGKPSPKEDQLPPQSEEPAFWALQAFARGEASLFASCGTRDSDIAIAAYTKAIAYGLPDPIRQSEAHHRLGLALRDKGRLADTQMHFEKALAIRPNIPEVINNLGTIFAEQGQTEKAIASFEKAIRLKANYARARFNLADVLEPINSKRALEEYETYLVLAEGFPEETARIALAQKRIEHLKNR
ncbi:MAG: tetratricopeptide repeat protein [Nitrospirales bacterium]|nr:tetratricopeptide repeat protein [Nitrospirales bacterium]